MNGMICLMNSDESAYLHGLATVLGIALRERDAYTHMHSDRVSQLAVAVGRRVSLDTAMLDRLSAAALLHDVGKIGIPDEVLLNPGTLDADQRAVMQSHSARGENILRAIHGEDTCDIANAVRHHHEEFRGGGYPDGLAGENIPVLSRIISVVDNYDAMSAHRVYHRPSKHSDVLRALHDDMGEKHDPYILGHFISVIEDSPLRVL